MLIHPKPNLIIVLLSIDIEEHSKINDKLSLNIPFSLAKFVAGSKSSYNYSWEFALCRRNVNRCAAQLKKNKKQNKNKK